MIKIYPTTASGLSSDDYGVLLRGDLVPTQARPGRVRTAIDGSAIVSRWQKRQDGAIISKEMTLNNADFEALRSITEHETVYTWNVASLNRRYECVIDMVNVRKIQQGAADWSCNVTFTVVKVLT